MKIRNSLYAFFAMQGILFLTVTGLFAGSQTAASARIPADSVQIVFLANVNASYENCHCGDHPLGGLDRVLTIVKGWRSQNPKLQIFDGGDFLNAYPYPALNRLILDLYALLRPDIVSLGDQELQSGNLAFQQELFKSRFPILNTNLRLADWPLQKVYKIYLKSRQIDVLHYLDSSCFLWEKPASDVRLSEASFKKAYNALPEHSYRIVIFHGEKDRLRNFIKRYPGIHLILLAHAQTKEFQNKRLPWILGPGTDSEYVTRLDLAFSVNKIRPSLKLVTVPVELSVKPDPQARKRIEQFLQTAK